MFTGIIEEIGRVAAVGQRLEIAAPKIGQDTRLGDSVAVNGTCLTVAEIKNAILVFDTMPLTLRDTLLGGLRAGDNVNLERALRADGRLGGHFVSGHVDEAGLVESWADNLLRVKVTEQKMLAPKGSITLNGVSLTIQDVAGCVFTVSLVKHTLRTTTLGSLRAGDKINVEYDLLLRYLQNLIIKGQPRAGLKRFIY
ncbi:riboflavin synthase alpha chain [Candidatus Termititenax persephonae]|uniref:Riboflavin synthase n=1 Tax=Candidatus Termititenax persephonae TaxID=2218525 RepID=A0A388TGG2_9BACT|nr:riboflavin synthase alpha chain [Candidatus Termititenax persephonae]